jgi:DNA mismatch endonuclease (patch repair protein)
MMAGIGRVDTGPELSIRRGLHARGFRYRLHGRDLPGRPDLVLPKWNVAIFVNGCFWHAHQGCRYFRIPGTRTAFWQEKLEGNRQRDERNRGSLMDSGWRVATVWECSLRGDHAPVEELANWIRTGGSVLELAGHHPGGEVGPAGIDEFE